MSEIVGIPTNGEHDFRVRSVRPCSLQVRKYTCHMAIYGMLQIVLDRQHLSGQTNNTHHCQEFTKVEDKYSRAHTE